MIIETVLEVYPRLTLEDVRACQEFDRHMTCSRIDPPRPGFDHPRVGVSTDLACAGDFVTQLARVSFEPIVSSQAAHSTSFVRPVLLVAGRFSHLSLGQPLQQGAPCVGDAYGSWSSHPYSVSNFTASSSRGSTDPLD